jgi:hypothetical protein
MLARFQWGRKVVGSRERPDLGTGGFGRSAWCFAAV